jgi:hypothetical protein
VSQQENKPKIKKKNYYYHKHKLVKVKPIEVVVTPAVTAETAKENEALMKSIDAKVLNNVLVVKGTNKKPNIFKRFWKWLF